MHICRDHRRNSRRPALGSWRDARARRRLGPPRDGLGVEYRLRFLSLPSTSLGCEAGTYARFLKTPKGLASDHPTRFFGLRWSLLLPRSQPLSHVGCRFQYLRRRQAAINQLIKAVCARLRVHRIVFVRRGSDRERAGPAIPVHFGGSRLPGRPAWGMSIQTTSPRSEFLPARMPTRSATITSLMTGCPDGDPAVREPDAIANARCVLGTQLAACRRAAGLSQVKLAKKTGFSRSTIANVETGRQNVPRKFWESADTAVSAGGTLVSAHDQVEAAARRARAGAPKMAEA